jgi:hypothetical protein
MTIPKLPFPARSRSIFSEPPKEETAHHFLTTYEVSSYGPRRLRNDLWILTKPYTDIFNKKYKAEWIELCKMSEWDICYRTDLTVIDLTVEPGGGFCCLLSKDEPVHLYWPLLDKILVLDSNGDWWTEEQKECRWGNYIFKL